MLAEVFALLTGRSEPLRLEIHPSLSGSAEEMAEALAKARDAEARAGHALLGPHRDDLRLTLGSGIDGTEAGGQDAHGRGADRPNAHGRGADGRSADGRGADGKSGGRRDTLFSQGEYRAALLALQLALGRLLELERGFRPLLILDDVFSELDRSVREHLLQYLPRLSNQMFITATDWNEPKHVPGARIMEIQAGRVAALRDEA